MVDSKITKHYYTGTKWIDSRIEIKTATEPRLSLDMELKAKQETDLKAIAKTLDCKEYKYEFNQYEAEADDEDTVAIRAEVPTPVFFYHPDHLGTSAVISNSAGAVHQYFFNLPFGETMIEGCTNTSYELNYKFNAKELDAESGLYYYGARYYDPRISVWMSVDPMADRYPSWSPYNYIYDNPTNGIDPDGRDGILIVFPNYKIDTETRLGKQPLGHAGVLLIDNKTGYTKYYEYGRYKTDDGTRGKVRTIAVPNVVIGADGKPTQESLNKVLFRISEKAGQGGKIEGSYVQGDFTKMNEYAQEKLKESNPQYKEYAKDRKPYSLTGNNCATFASDVLKQDAEAKKRAPWILNPTPKNIGKEYQDNFPEVNYNPKTKTTTSDIYKKNKK